MFFLGLFGIYYKMGFLEIEEIVLIGFMNVVDLRVFSDCIRNVIV